MSIHLHTYPAKPQAIDEMASWPASQHLFEANHILALRAAQATGRPLLVRGEAGTGKSQLAHAAAFVTGRAFLPVVVGSDTIATDLHWKFDAIARLADAQMAARHIDTAHGDTARSALQVAHYVQPGPLWWAFDWAGALRQQQQCHHGATALPDTPENWTPQKGLVLLIDEIDKAEPDVPNGLLEALANHAFNVPLLGMTVKQAKDCPPPLIIITTNDERELPAAFLRRCQVITLALPSGDQALCDWLIERGQLHFPTMKQAIMAQAASMLVTDRKAAKERRCYQPGLAEYLDLLRAVEQMEGEGEAAMATLKQFYFDKQPADNEA